MLILVINVFDGISDSRVDYRYDLTGNHDAKNLIVNDMIQNKKFKTRATAGKLLSRIAWLFILIVDAGFVAWGAMAALAPEHLPGPGFTPIVKAEFEGFTAHSWSELNSNSPVIAD